MDTRIWVSQVIIALAAAFPGNELLPERYLQPRDFNYHPYTDVGIPAALRKNSVLSSAYAVVEKLRSKSGDKFSEGNVAHFSPPLSKSIETNELPKNYAFTYTVKDKLSGDEFSHSQAHNGKSTKGQYRVNLPDGRTQIVRYTADHTGYNADVQYEDSILEKPFSKSLFQPVQTGTDRLPQILQNAYSAYPTDFLAKNFPLRKIESATVQSLTLKSAVSNYLPNPVTISPLKLQSGNSLVKLVVNHHGSSPLLPQYYKSDYLTNYVPTVAPFPHQNYVSSTPPPQYLSLTSTPLYPIVP